MCGSNESSTFLVRAGSIPAAGSLSEETVMNEAQIKISQYLMRSAGNCNVPSDHTIRCFIGMIETGEATMDDMQKVGGDYLVNRINSMALENGWSLDVA